MEPPKVLADWPQVAASRAVELQLPPPAAEGVLGHLPASDSLHSDQTAEESTRGGLAAATQPTTRRKPGRPAREKACMVCGVLLPQGEVPNFFRVSQVGGALR